MQNRTNLGITLGQALAGALGGDDLYRQRGAVDGMRVKTMQSQVAENEAQAAKTKQEIDARSDDSLIKSLVGGIQNGKNGDNVLNDFKAFSEGTYKPREQQGPGMAPGSYMPAPDYVSKFPELQQQFGKLKQMLALGDKDLPNLAKSIQGDQRNAITAKLTPENAATIGMQTSAIDGDDPMKIGQADILQRALKDPKNIDLLNTLLVSQGKGAYDSFNGGALNVLTGEQELNGIGSSMVTENNASAAQSYAGAGENKAQSRLADARTEGVKSGKGDGSSAQAKDFAQIRDDIRSDYNAQFPTGMTGQRPKNAPDYNSFTKSWLKQYNVDENEFFRANKGRTETPATAPATTKAAAKNPQYDQYLQDFNKLKGNPAKQKAFTEWARKKGIVK
jgi:hypothetical protein